MLVFYGVASVVSIFYVSSIIFKDSLKAPYIATILYTFCNYHMYNQFLKQALGEIFAIVIIPIVLFSIYEVLVLNKDSWMVLV